MSSLKEELIDWALRKGATNVRVTTKERMEGPPSADATYLLPDTRSIIAFAVGLDRSFIPDYFGKVSRLGFKHVMYHTYQLLGSIGQDLAAYLEFNGFKAVAPAPNTVYRPEMAQPGNRVPPLSHRYAALVSGLATLGWSGNILLPEYRAAAFYCSVVTNAELEPDEPMSEDLCDNCKLCTLVCPSRYFSARETQTAVMGGREYVSAKKRNQIRCGIVCGGLLGLSHDEKWSTWSTGRAVKLPEDDEALSEIYDRVTADAGNEHARELWHRRKAYLDFARTGRGCLSRGLEETNPTCCNCALVCSGPREWREKLVKLLHSSGVVVWQDGRELVTDADTETSQALLRDLKEVEVLV